MNLPGMKMESRVSNEAPPPRPKECILFLTSTTSENCLKTLILKLQLKTIYMEMFQLE